MPFFPSGEEYEDSGDEYKNDIPEPPRDPERPGGSGRQREIQLGNYRIRFNWDEPEEDEVYTYIDNSFSYPNFSNTAGLSLNGGITVANDSSLGLLTGQYYDTNSVFRTNAVNYNTDWSMSFRINNSTSSSADGWAVVWAPSSTYLNASGGAVGYFNSTLTSGGYAANTKALAFRMWNYNDLIWAVDGGFTSSTQFTGYNWKNNFYYWLDYTVSNQTLKLYLSYTNTKPATPLRSITGVSFGTNNYYVGFTSATGSGTGYAYLNYWSLSMSGSTGYANIYDDDDENEGLKVGQSPVFKYRIQVQSRAGGGAGWNTVEDDFTKHRFYVYHAPVDTTNILYDYRARIWSVDSDGDQSLQWLNSNNGGYGTDPDPNAGNDTTTPGSGSGPSIGIISTTIPAVPTGMTLSLSTDEQERHGKYRLKAAWNEVSTDVTNLPQMMDYYVVRLDFSDDNTTWHTDVAYYRKQVVAAKDSDTDTMNSTIFKNVRRNRYYRIQVRAVNGAGYKSAWSGWSASLRAGSSDVPANVAVPVGVLSGPRRIEFDWTDSVETEIDRYLVKIYKSTSSSGPWTDFKTRYVRSPNIAVHVKDEDKTSYFKIGVKGQFTADADGNRAESANEVFSDIYTAQDFSFSLTGTVSNQQGIRVFNKVGLVRQREYEAKWYADKVYRIVRLRAVVGKHDPALHPSNDDCPTGSAIQMNLIKYDADYDINTYTNLPNGYLPLFASNAKMEIAANSHRSSTWIESTDPDCLWTIIQKDESISVKVTQVGAIYPGAHLRIFITLEPVS